MVSQYVYDLCRQEATVSSELARDPSDKASNIVKRLYGNNKNHTPSSTESSSPRDVLDMAFECGHWGPNKPSPLFLQAFADALSCLDSNPLAGMVSPPLMGSHGTVPLTIIAPLVDAIRHCATLIRNARKEVFFMTCKWRPSGPQQIIKDALIDLSAKAGERGERVNVRVMYDLPKIWHVLESHQNEAPSTGAFKELKLPSPEEIPNLDLEIINSHMVLLGTLHAKVCIVDGVVAALMSNNIEDNANIEMLTHLEGPIVASIYDTALNTWGKALNERPSINELSPDDSDVNGEEKHSRYEGTVRDENNLEEESRQADGLYDPVHDESLAQAVNRQFNISFKKDIPPTGPEITEADKIKPFIPTITPHPIPMALVSRPAYGSIDCGNTYVPQNEAWLSLVRNAQKDIFIQTPNLNTDSLLDALSAALKRGVEVTYYVCFGYNDAGEMIPGQGGTNEQAAGRLIKSLEGDKKALELLSIYNYIAKDQNRPIHDQFKRRSCHVKLLIADDTVGVQGSGNQDAQSWCHSQELNVMIDSPEVCKKWRWGIEQNQNTRAFGKVSSDGVWRDAEGNPGRGYSGDPGVVDGLVKGVIGMAKKGLT